MVKVTGKVLLVFSSYLYICTQQLHMVRLLGVEESAVNQCQLK